MDIRISRLKQVVRHYNIYTEHDGDGKNFPLIIHIVAIAVRCESCLTNMERCWGTPAEELAWDRIAGRSL